MAHKVESIAYAGARPWHGLGKDVTGQDLTPIAMAKVAGIDWFVEKAPIYQKSVSDDGTESFVEIPRTYSLRRSSDGSSLSIVGEMYHPIQNLEAIDFLTKFVEAGHMKMETIGSLCRGRLIWALASIDRDFVLAGDDKVRGFVLISIPHMHGHGITIKHTSVRVVCWNTISSALRQSGSAFRMPHLKAFDDSAKVLAARTLGLAEERSTSFEDVARKLSETKADPDKVLEFIVRTFDRKAKTATKKIEDAVRPARVAFSALDTQPGAKLESSDGTWWGALNAVTYTVDHLLGRDRDAALNAAWFGGRANTKLRALELASEYAGIK
jgi:phage/plasmid-like protein (TIGR03299 family)